MPLRIGDCGLRISLAASIRNPQSEIRNREVAMTTFSNDVDILKCEPVLFGELHLSSQVRARGTGATLSGTTLIAAGADFVAQGVEAGGVIYLRSADGSPDGAYEIVSVDAATGLTISVARSSAADPAIAPPPGNDLFYRVSTLQPQAEDAAFRLTEYFGLRPGNPASTIGVEDLLDTEGLRRASVLAVIAAIYATWSSQPEADGFWNKSRFYQERFEKARQRCHVTVDLGADGVADVTRVGGAIRLIRD
jgi:hypothetical protein